MSNADRGKNTDQLEEVELVVDLADEKKTPSEQPEDERAEGETEASAERRREKIRLNREQTLQDLRELQDLTVERASGRTSDLE